MISVMLNNCVAWSAEEFAVRLEVFAKFLGTKRCGFITRLIFLSDGFGFLSFDGETVGPWAGRLRSRSIINDKQVSKDTVLGSINQDRPS